MAEELPPRLDRERVSLPRSNRLRVWLHHVHRQRVEFSVFLHTGELRPDRVRVVIDGLDLGDFGGELRIDGKLAVCGDRDEQRGAQQLHWMPRRQPGLSQVIFSAGFARPSTKAQGASPKRCNLSTSQESPPSGAARTTGVPSNDASFAPKLN